jgi:DHA1 family tetracycline resistance protein-like MFS transporter
VSETTPSIPAAAVPTKNGRRVRPAALGFIYAAVLMNTISMGVIIPVFPVLVKTLTGKGDAGAAEIMGVFGAVWALMQLTFAPIFGNLSDRFGRRPVLLVAMFGLGFDYLIMALAPNIAWLFIGRLISGIAAASGSAGGAYVADISPPPERARNFGRFQAAANAGTLIGPMLGGFVGVLDPRAPFWVAAAFALANGLYGLFLLPESLGHERRMPFRWRRANPVGAAALLVSRKGLLGLACVLFMAQFAGASFNSVFQFYTHFRYGWGPVQVAILLVVLSGGNIVMQSLAAGWVAGRIGERGAVIVGMSLGVAGFVGLGLAPTAALFWVALAIVIVSGMTFPNLSSLLSQRVGVDQQGQLGGALAILFGLSQLIGPLVFTDLFAWSIGPGAGWGLPGLSMMAGGGFILLGVALAIGYARPPQAPLASESR